MSSCCHCQHHSLLHQRIMLDTSNCLTHQSGSGWYVWRFTKPIFGVLKLRIDECYFPSYFESNTSGTFPIRLGMNLSRSGRQCNYVNNNMSDILVMIPQQNDSTTFYNQLWKNQSPFYCVEYESPIEVNEVIIRLQDYAGNEINLDSITPTSKNSFYISLTLAVVSAKAFSELST